jgi:RNA polymerase sigma-70 factor (ECF subfamily)
VDPDETLLQRVREGDLEAFDALYERHETRLFAYLRSVTKDRHDAEELLHDAFLGAIKTTRTTFEEGAFRGYLYRVARNLAFNRRRSGQRHERMLASASNEGPAASAGAHAALERRELEGALTEAVRRLPTTLGELYHLRSSGLSYEQIASVVGSQSGP